MNNFDADKVTNMKSFYRYTLPDLSVRTPPNGLAVYVISDYLRRCGVRGALPCAGWRAKTNGAWVDKRAWEGTRKLLRFCLEIWHILVHFRCIITVIAGPYAHKRSKIARYRSGLALDR